MIREHLQMFVGKMEANCLACDLHTARYDQCEFRKFDAWCLSLHSDTFCT